MRKYLKLTFSGDNPDPAIFVNIDSVSQFHYNLISTIIWLNSGINIEIFCGGIFEPEYLKFLNDNESLLVIKCESISSSRKK